MTDEKMDEMRITLKPDFESSSKPKLYSNFVSVSHDRYAFLLSFCDVQFEAISKDKLTEKDGQGAYIVKAPIAAQIVIPFDLMEKFIEACSENYVMFRKKKLLERRIVREVDPEGYERESWEKLNETVKRIKAEAEKDLLRAKRTKQDDLKG